MSDFVDDGRSTTKKVRNSAYVNVRLPVSSGLTQAGTGKTVLPPRMTWIDTRRVFTTQGRSMQAGNIYREGDAVSAKDEGEGKEKFYVEEVVESGDYNLRKSEAKEKQSSRRVTTMAKRSYTSRRF